VCVASNESKDKVHANTNKNAVKKDEMGVGAVASQDVVNQGVVGKVKASGALGATKT